MKTLANINDNINIKFNKTMTTISENAESQQVAGNRAEEMMASAIAHEAKMAEIKAAEEQEEKMNLRITPEVHFVPDMSAANGAHIATLLEDITKKSAEHKPENPGASEPHDDN